ncbi:MAG: CDP-diacylglycerol--glycerol-3-phosphate 3-phosphatidyltransferase [Waddliaceae bacterium]|nr:CDP-diacylglycerol--glycerol-3-phosphate 3-phosphatidyltransferase [Waddliaceae bacterium]
MWTFPNILSLLRAPLAFLLLIPDTGVRLCVIVLAMITDALDGYLARTLRCVSPIGTIVDPLMDRFFVLFALGIFLTEHHLTSDQILAMISRDMAICLFGLYLGVSGTWGYYRFQAIWCGKITTTLQFLVLIALTQGYPVPQYVFSGFVVLGMLALGELALIYRHTVAKRIS